jgi:hypothetical protein
LIRHWSSTLMIRAPMKIGGKMVSIFQYNDVYVPLFITCTAKLAISIARKMNALIFLVPEDIVDVRPRLVRHPLLCCWEIFTYASLLDLDLCRKLDECCTIVLSRLE